MAFLNCGSALQPILPKSQCWCINEDNSRFVLQIRRPQYWRIELPVSEPDDQNRALKLKDILDKILLFEKTECPFERSFIVPLPERSPTPIKLKAWTPEGKNLISTPFSDLSPLLPSARLYGRERRDSYFGDGTGSFNRERDEDEVDMHRKSDSEEPTGSDDPSKLSRANIAFIETREKFNQAPTLVSDDAKHGEYTMTTEGEKATVSAGQNAVEAYSSNSTPARAVPAAALEKLEAIEEATSDNVDVHRQETVLQDAFVSDAKKGRVQDKDIANEPSSFEGSGRVAPINLAKKRRSRVLAGRAFTAPPQLTVVTSPPSKREGKSSGPTNIETQPQPQPQPQPPPQPIASDKSSPVGSTDSFHSVQSWHSPITPLPPSPPSSRPATPSLSQFPHPHENIILPHRSSCAKDSPAHTRTPDTDKTFVPSSAGATDHTDETISPGLRSPDESADNHASTASVDGSVEVSRASALEERHQARLRPRPRNSLSFSRQALSPIGSAANFFSPPRRQSPQSRMSLVRRLPSTIIQKTIELLLGPPSYLVNLMLKVAAKIVAGEWRGLVFGVDEDGEKIPVQWDYSDGEFSDWSDEEEYEYAMAQCSRSNSSSSNPRAAANGNKQNPPGGGDSHSWEVD